VQLALQRRAGAQRGGGEPGTRQGGESASGRTAHQPRHATQAGRRCTCINGKAEHRMALLFTGEPSKQSHIGERSGLERTSPLTQHGLAQ